MSIKSLSDIELDADIPETQETIEGNARQKARFIYEKTGMDCFADDTGLEIAALGGRPGVYSARYAGEGCSFADNVIKILEELQGIEDRSACFRCVICLIYKGQEAIFEGRVDGEITLDQSGAEGFGYDPVFWVPEYRCASAELPASVKNALSHRGQALRSLTALLKARGLS